MTTFEHPYEEHIAYLRDEKEQVDLGHIWQFNIPEVQKKIVAANTPEELVRAVDKTFMFAVNFPFEDSEKGELIRQASPPEIRRLQIDWLLDRQERAGLKLFSFPDTVQESPFIFAQNVSSVGGRRLSGNFLRTLSIASRMKKFGGEIENVFELGGGAGHLARTLLLLNPDCRYTLVDLPEVLFCAYSHLKLCFPDKKSVYVSRPEMLAEAAEADICFIPVAFSDELIGKRFQWFVNTASMGEMANPTIRYWMDMIQCRIDIDHLYTLNRFLNPVKQSNVTEVRKMENECSVLYDGDWNMLHWELEPEFCRCPYIDTQHSRYVEICASRQPQSGQKKQQVSKELLEKVRLEDWYRSQRECLELTSLMNPVAIDRTRDGCLFKLWESIRLHTNKENLRTMVAYLEYLSKNPETKFEEHFYYQKLLEST